MNEFTRHISPKEPFKSQYGFVTGEQWCHNEANRLIDDGIHAEVMEDKKGRLYVVRGALLPSIQHTAGTCVDASRPGKPNN